MSLSAAINEEIVRIVKLGMNEVRQRTLEDQRTLMLRRLRGGYDKLSLDQITRTKAALGHADTEERPCQACRIIAQKEYDLAED